MIFGHLFSRGPSSEYSKVSTQDLLSKFKTENWSQLNSEQRLGVFQELENRYAKEQHRPAAKIEAEGNSSNLGSYSSSGNTIKIRVDDFPGNNSYEQLDSYFHESRHAQQAQAIKTGKGLDETTKDMCQVEMAHTKEGHLYNYINTDPYYDLQTCEMDSNNFATSKLLENKELFQDDASFDKYIMERQKHFEKVNKSNQERGDMRARIQTSNIDRSLQKGDISKGQAIRLKEHIYSDEDDPVQLESREIGINLKNYNSKGLGVSSSNDTISTSRQQRFFEDDSENLTQVAAKSEYESLKHQKFFEEKESSQTDSVKAKGDTEENTQMSQFNIIGQ